MKKALLFPALFGLTIFSQAQLRIAFVGGVHSSSVSETNSMAGWDSISKNYTGRTGIHAGMIADLQLSTGSKFYFQPGVLFYNKGRNYSGSKDSTVVFPRFGLPDSIVNTTYLETKKEYLNYIDIPLNLVYKLPLGKSKFIFGGGPYVSIFYNGFENIQQTLVDVDYNEEKNEDLPVGKKQGQYKIFNYGVNALAGIEFKKIFITANYSRGLNNYYTSADDAGHKHQTIGGTLGIFLGKPVPLIDPPKDSDQDGVIDDKDECPNEPGVAVTNGCPDHDADGIADKIDKCPDVAGLSKYAGCPIPDTDKDGVNDEEDKCPDMAGTIKYNGCPIPDTDKDGVNDEEDSCLNVAGILKYKGCPIPDTDKDGVNDEEDKCPTVAGMRENGGCPAVKKELIEKVNYAAKNIQFTYAKAGLLASSYSVLNEVVEILKQNSELQLSIEGHSSTDGNYDVNMRLSQQRADNVKKYLISKGISPSRLTSKGFGPNKPLNEGKTESEKALNRRVELKLSNQ
jgi:outer membrane protein OmpA-like peptidoglycan-associated protein